eukprot:1928759-Prymnesium_polylepis.1
MGDIKVGIGGSLMSLQWPKKVDFRPARLCRGGTVFTGGRNRDPMPSSTLAPFPHTMRGWPDHRSASHLGGSCAERRRSRRHGMRVQSDARAAVLGWNHLLTTRAARCLGTTGVLITPPGAQGVQAHQG